MYHSFLSFSRLFLCKKPVKKLGESRPRVFQVVKTIKNQLYTKTQMSGILVSGIQTVYVLPNKVADQNFLVIPILVHFQMPQRFCESPAEAPLAFTTRPS
jgi:hypothetical protein